MTVIVSPFVLCAVLAAAISIGDARAVKFSILMAAVWALNLAFLPEISWLGAWWYVVCIVMELVIVTAAVLSGSEAARIVAGLSVAAALLHVSAEVEYLTIHNGLVRMVYPEVSRSIEWIQVFALIVFSPFIRSLAATIARYFIREDARWTRMSRTSYRF